MRLWSEILQVEDTLFRKIFNHYRPELHYMRGAGPKWIEKHSAVAECAMPQVSGSGSLALLLCNLHQCVDSLHHGLSKRSTRDSRSWTLTDSPSPMSTAMPMCAMLKSPMR